VAQLEQLVPVLVGPVYQTLWTTAAHPALAGWRVVVCRGDAACHLPVFPAPVVPTPITTTPTQAGHDTASAAGGSATPATTTAVLGSSGASGIPLASEEGEGGRSSVLLRPVPPEAMPILAKVRPVRLSSCRQPG
jgi:hypothetical protein